MAPASTRSAPDAGTRTSEEHRPQRTGWFFLVVLVLLAVLGGLLFAFARTLGILDTEPVTVGVPTWSANPSTRRAGNSTEGFKVRRQDQESSTVAEGTVIESSPERRDAGRRRARRSA